MFDVRILAPRKQRQLVIDGYSVPMMEAVEEDGGNVLLLLDGRIGCSVPAAQFEQVACFVADVIGACWGYGAHPRKESPPFDPRVLFDRVPHQALAPHRMHEVVASSVEVPEEAPDV